MSVSGLFDIGKSLLFASQTSLNVISNNIANVNTPGFNRQEVILEVTSPVSISGNFIGRGVTVSRVKRHYDNFINLQLIGQSQNYGRSTALKEGLSYIEQIFNEVKDLGLSSELREYFNVWHEVAANPEGSAQRTVLLQKANSLIQSAVHMEQGLISHLKHINENIVDIVGRINSIASDISSLNDQIVSLEAGLGTQKASYFRDERDRLLKELGELVEISWYENNNGALTINISRQTLVSPEGPYMLSTYLDVESDRHISLNGEDITSSITKGQLGGYIDVRKEIKLTPLHNIRKLVASIIKEVNLLHTTGYGLDGSTGNDFFSPLQIFTRGNSLGAYITSANITNLSVLTLNEYDIRFVTSSDYEVYNRQTGALVTSGTYTPGGPISFDGIEVTIDGSPATGDSFFISPLEDAIKNFSVSITVPRKIAAASSVGTLPGDNTLATQIVQLSQSAIANLDGATFEGYYNGLVSSIGSLSESAEDSFTFDENLRFELEKKRDAVSGVSLDEEAANLIRFQRSYEAGARIIKVTDELFETLINML